MTTMSPRLADLHSEYLLAVEAQNVRAEAVTGGYPTETARYFGTDGEGDGVEQRITWKQWLIDHRGEPEPEEVEIAGAVDEAMGVVSDADVSDREFFRMGKAELAEWVEVGSVRARAEIERRAARRAARRQVAFR